MPPLDEIRARIDAHAVASPDGSVETRTAIEGLLIAKVTRTSAPVASLAQPCVALIAQGAKRISVGDRVHEYGTGQYLVVTTELPVMGCFTQASVAEPCLGLALALEPGAIAALLLEAGGGGPRAAAPATGVSAADEELLDAVARLLRLLDRPADAPVLAPLVRREILWRLLRGPQGAVVRQIGLADSHLSHLNRAVRWIRDHHAQTLRVEDLARMAGMSPSTFHRQFRAITAMSPLQYQKHVRLQEARLRLLAQPGDVAGAGYAVGYDSPSQFGREYRRMFGVSPGRDAARLRASVDAA